MPTNARERLVRAAEDLFYAEGIRAVGVERLLATSGVGRASFYRHFASKDDLVVAMIDGYGRRWFDWLHAAVAERGGTPLALFDALAARFASDDYRGCAAINTMVEIADPASAAHRAAAAHKATLTSYVAELLTGAGYARGTRELAEQLVLLIDGAQVTALRERSAAPALRAKAVATALLAAA
ncbi:TetR family transcriptional regulator [Streptomyces rimosus subsp. pseudoverticillatus]|uniref:TetR/AcrR family transcriptional regulator n=1 Tax=Streptomyces rimosus TaxID=1927 RepID=UPI0006B26DB0|nr:TetR/AcrR family transcriptional regulator [Streptomyces rimosus]KOU00004.1 TetR family transcriptional regulator [Streptomyces rimosus subsp. pseudoverticillatus]